MLEEGQEPVPCCHDPNESAGTSTAPKSSLRDDYGFVIQSPYVSLYHTFSHVWHEDEIERCHVWDAWISKHAPDAASTSSQLYKALKNGPLSDSREGLEELHALVRIGIPKKYRKVCWKLFLDIDSIRVDGEYARLLNTLEEREREQDHGTRPGAQDDTLPEEDFMGQIDKDLHRTFPDHPLLMEGSDGKKKLRRMLGGYAMRNPLVGYCQGLNFLAAVFLLLYDGDTEEEEAFWCFVSLVENILTGYFDPMMINQQVDGLVFEQLLQQLLPRVASHIEDIGVHVPTAVAGWFLVAFVNSFPIETLLRVWDMIFFEKSPVVLFRVGLAQIDIFSEALLEARQDVDAYMLFQAMGPMSFDAGKICEKACVHFSHVKDSALRILRDKYAPGITRVMEKMYNVESNLPSMTISTGVPKAPQSRMSSSSSITTGRKMISDGRISNREKSTEEGKGFDLEGIKGRLGILRLRHKDQTDSSGDLLVQSKLESLRRTQSASLSNLYNSSGHKERLQQQLRINLLSMSTFIPNLSIAPVATAFRIAGNIPSRARTLFAEKQTSTKDKSQTQVLQKGYGSGRTIDISASVSKKSQQGDGPASRATPPVSRRFTDGGALVIASSPQKHTSTPIWSKASPSKVHMHESQVASITKQNLKALAVQLEKEVVIASQRLEDISTRNVEKEHMIQDLSTQLEKIQDEVEHKADILNALFQRRTHLEKHASELELQYRKQLTENDQLVTSWKVMQEAVLRNNQKLKELMELAGKSSRGDSSPTKNGFQQHVHKLIGRKFTST